MDMRLEYMLNAKEVVATMINIAEKAKHFLK
jgi:hypothetical protein